MTKAEIKDQMRKLMAQFKELLNHPVLTDEDIAKSDRLRAKLQALDDELNE